MEPTVDNDSNDPLIFTMTYLQNNTGEVIRRMNHENRKAVITRKGRLVALLEPLANIDNLEGKLISEGIRNGSIVIESSDASDVTTNE